MTRIGELADELIDEEYARWIGSETSPVEDVTPPDEHIAAPIPASVAEASPTVIEAFEAESRPTSETPESALISTPPPHRIEALEDACGQSSTTGYADLIPTPSLTADDDVSMQADTTIDTNIDAESSFQCTNVKQSPRTSSGFRSGLDLIKDNYHSSPAPRRGNDEESEANSPMAPVLPQRLDFSQNTKAVNGFCLKAVLRADDAAAKDAYQDGTKLKPGVRPVWRFDVFTAVGPSRPHLSVRFAI